MEHGLTQRNTLQVPTHASDPNSSCGSETNAADTTPSPPILNTQLDIDEALNQSGSCGRFQYLTQILITYLVISFGYKAFFSYFIANDPPWKCISRNSTFCVQNFARSISADNANFTMRCKLQRNEWTYTTDLDYSIVTEFDLICGKTSIAALAGSIYHLGGGIGFFIAGLAADHYGRKYVLISVLSISLTVSILCRFVSEPWELIALRAFLGAATVSAYNVSYNYLSEFIAPSYRTVGAIVYGLGFATSQIILAGAASYCRKWRHLQLYTTLPLALGIASLFLLPESPRWLLANKKNTKAESILKRIGKINGHPVPSLTLKAVVTVSRTVKYTYLDLIRNRKVALVTLLQAFLWLSVGMCYYTIAFESSNLGLDIYRAFVFSALAEIPSKFVACYTCNRFGRKPSTLLPLVFTGVFVGSTTLIPSTFHHKNVANMVLMMLARFFVDIAEQSVYMWSFELFPTVLRLQGAGVCIICARTGSFAGPFLSTVLQKMNANLPRIILTVFSLLAAAIGLMLPETNKKPTRENYDDFFQTPSPTRSNKVQNASEDVEEREA